MKKVREMRTCDERQPLSLGEWMKGKGREIYAARGYDYNECITYGIVYAEDVFFMWMVLRMLCS